MIKQSITIEKVETEVWDRDDFPTTKITAFRMIVFGHDDNNAKFVDNIYEITAEYTNPSLKWSVNSRNLPILLTFASKAIYDDNIRLIDWHCDVSLDILNEGLKRSKQSVRANFRDLAQKFTGKTFKEYRSAIIALGNKYENHQQEVNF